MTSGTHIDGAAILAVLAEQRGARACLEAAQDAWTALEGASGITALHVRVDPIFDIMPTEEVLSKDRQRLMELDAVKEGHALHDIYAAWMVGLPANVPSNWYDIGGSEDAKIEEFARIARMTVIARLDAHSRGHAHEAFHTCLFRTEKPLLVVPDRYQKRDVRRILVAWKDTAPSRRALEAAAPWLKNVEQVLLLRIGDERPLELEWAVERLVDLGVRSKTLNVPRNLSLSVGQQILREAHAVDADWIVAGAFHHGEFLGWILGGVTETLLKEATLPVFFMH